MKITFNKKDAEKAMMIFISVYDGDVQKARDAMRKELPDVADSKNNQQWRALFGQWLGQLQSGRNG